MFKKTWTIIKLEEKGDIHEHQETRQKNSLNVGLEIHIKNKTSNKLPEKTCSVN